MICDFYHASHQGSKYKQGYHLWSSFFDNHDQTFVTHWTLISFNSQVGWLAENDILHSAFITIVWINADCDCLMYLLFYDNNIIMESTLKIRIHTTEKRNKSNGIYLKKEKLNDVLSLRFIYIKNTMGIMGLKQVCFVSPWSGSG